jgi:putative acetyltransferase
MDKVNKRGLAVKITRGDLSDPRIVELLEFHASSARAQTAPGSAHALDLNELHSADIEFWALRDGAILVGIGALKRLSADHGEVKSMHVIATRRRSGAGGMMLRHIIARAGACGLSRLSLETGSWDYFAPARALYAKHGFAECPPFADYAPDPNSVFMSLDLVPA